MEWFGLGIGIVSAVAAIWSAVSSHRSAHEAKDTRRPYVAVTGNQVSASDGNSGSARFFITNAGPVPGRMMSQTNVTTSSAGQINDHGTGSTQSDLVYPEEVEPIGFGLPATAGDQIDLSLNYEDLASEQVFRFEILYAVDSNGELQIVRREGRRD